VCDVVFVLRGLSRLLSALFGRLRLLWMLMSVFV